MESTDSDEEVVMDPIALAMGVVFEVAIPSAAASIVFPPKTLQPAAAHRRTIVPGAGAPTLRFPAVHIWSPLKF